MDPLTPSEPGGSPGSPFRAGPDALEEHDSMDASTESERGHIVEIRGATKRFATPEGGTVVALDRVSFSVRNNEFITLLGPSGCGKTTLLRTVSGFEDLDEGEIFVEGAPMKSIPPHRRPVNTVFQNYALFPHLTVDDNVGYSLDVARVPRTERHHRVAATLKMVNLTGLERRKPRQLSGGEQQRVALARAIINLPKLLLLDEPLSALDRKLRQAMELELKNLQHELGISFIFVTHDQEEALTMSDRIVVMDSGRIQQIGTSTEVYNRPRNAFVAHFIGESNLFRGKVLAVHGGIAEVETKTGVLLRLRAANLRPGQQVEVVIRPECLHLDTGTRNPAGDDGGQISGTLQQTVFVGSESQLIVRLPGDFTLKALVRDSAHEAVAALAPGTEVAFSYGLDAPHVLFEEEKP